MKTRPVAFVQAVAPVDGEAAKAQIAATVPYDLSVMTVISLTELPMTPTGKIAKAELAARAAAA